MLIAFIFFSCELCAILTTSCKNYLFTNKMWELKYKTVFYIEYVILCTSSSCRIFLYGALDV